MSFGKSFDEAFRPAMASSQAGTFDALKEKIKQDTEKAKESNNVANNLSIVAEVAKSADPETQQLLAKLIGDDTKSWDSESSDSLVKLAIANSKDKKDFEQTMQTERYKAQVSFIPEVTKEMVASGKYSPEQTQDFAALASRIAQSRASGTTPSTQPKPNGGLTDAESIFGSTLPPKLSAEQEKVKGEASTALDNFEGLMGMFKGSPQGVISGNVAEAIGNFTGGALNTKGAVYKDFAPMVSGQIYIGMTGDSRLSEADAEARAKPLLPRQGDSTKKNKLKEDFMRATLEERNRRYASGDFNPISQKEIMKNFNDYISSGGKKGGWNKKTVKVRNNETGEVEEMTFEEAKKLGAT